MSAQKSQQVNVKLFGAFRDFLPSGVCTLTLSGSESVSEIKSLISEHLATSGQAKFDVENLVSKSVLATESKVLLDTDLVNATELAILPPVCGG